MSTQAIYYPYYNNGYAKLMVGKKVWINYIYTNLVLEVWKTIWRVIICVSKFNVRRLGYYAILLFILQME